jgi:hypothetical protein
LENGGVECKFRHQEERSIIPVSKITDYVETSLKALEKTLENMPNQVTPME